MTPGMTDPSPLPPAIEIEGLTKVYSDGKVALDHVNALINGGENRESNLRPVHIKCHAEKTRADVAEKVRVAAKRQAARGIAAHVKKLESRQFDQSPKQAKNQARAAERAPLPPRQIYAEQTR